MNKVLLPFIVILFLVSLTYMLRTPKSKKSCNKSQEINILIRQAARWSAAAEQDESPIIALLHANYGAGFLWALKDIATDQEIYNSSGIDVLKFKKTITDIQDQVTKRVTKACPQFTGNINNFLLELGGDK